MSVFSLAKIDACGVWFTCTTIYKLNSIQSKTYAKTNEFVGNWTVEKRHWNPFSDVIGFQWPLMFENVFVKI